MALYSVKHRDNFTSTSVSYYLIFTFNVLLYETVSLDTEKTAAYDIL